MSTINFVFNESIKNSENRIYKKTIDDLVEAGCKKITINGNENESDVNVVSVGISSDKDYILSREKSGAKSYLSIVDLYSFEFLKTYASLFSGFLVPTEEHRKILQMVTKKPVFVFFESIDPIYACSENAHTETVQNVAWFGYPESFNKSMSHLLAVIDEVLVPNKRKFKIITGRSASNINTCLSANLEVFDEKSIARLLNDVGLVILSHIPLDLQLNTYIKSPNKLYSAIAAGALPLCSNTPAYSNAMKRLGLNDFIFSSPIELKAVLKKTLGNEISNLIIAAQYKLNEISLENIKSNSDVLEQLRLSPFEHKDTLDDIAIKTVKQVFPLRVQVFELIKTIKSFI